MECWWAKLEPHSSNCAPESGQLTLQKFDCGGEIWNSALGECQTLEEYIHSNRAIWDDSTLLKTPVMAKLKARNDYLLNKMQQVAHTLKSSPAQR